MRPIHWMRSLIALLYLVCGGLIASLLVVVLAIFGRRNKAQHAVERIWAGGVLWLAGIRVQVIGAENLPKTGCVITPNHRSNADVLSIMGCAATPARFVAKSELKWVFFISLGMWMAGHIFVTRGRRESGGRALGAASEELKKGAWVLLFPEGTRVASDQSKAWKTGAFRVAIDAQVPVVPTVIKNARNLWPPEALFPKPGLLVVEFLSPVDTAGMVAKEHTSLRNTVRQAVVERLGE